jgi:hypothetical protein
MRLLTHNTLRNNSHDAQGKGFPLKITAAEVKVIEHPTKNSVDPKDLDFIKRILPTLEWSALVEVRLLSSIVTT